MDITEILHKLTKLGFKIIASCPGYTQERFIKPRVQPSILFLHSEESISIFIEILKNMGFNMKKLNDVLKSRFSSNLVMEWIFIMPDSLYKIESETDIKIFWELFDDAVTNVINSTEK